MRAASSWLPEISQMWARSFLSRLAADCLRAKVYSEPSVGLGVSLCVAAQSQDGSKVQACRYEKFAVAAICSQDVMPAARWCSATCASTALGAWLSGWPSLQTCMHEQELVHALSG